MIKFFVSLICLLPMAQAYTLNNNFGASFSRNRVKVLIAGNTTCQNINMTVYELQDLIAPAIDDFWNRVPKSKLRLVDGGFTDNIDRADSGRLCAPTDEECITEGSTAPAPGLIPPVEEIVIACNSYAPNFEGDNVIAVTIPNNFDGKKIKGAMILINDTATSTVFAQLSRADKISVLAHEIGHAIGLGHSEDTAALMYYKVVDLRRDLGQDDMDGVSYLYPVKLDACGLLGTVDLGKSDPQMWQVGIGFMLVLLLSSFKKLFKRA